MAPRYILALDQGTTSSRAILFDRDANIVQVAQKEFTQIYPEPGWVEHSPNEIFDSQAQDLHECLRLARVSGNEIAAVGIANQRETTIVWEKSTGAPVYNAIVWQDRRTAAFCDQLRADGKAHIIQEKTGLVLDAYFSGSKVRWILDNVPGARAKADAGGLLFGTVDSWIVWNLSKRGVHVTDPSNASRTMMFNIHTGQWDSELLEIVGVPPSMLPEVVPSSSHLAEVHPEFFGRAVPVAGIAGDQQAATYGNACMSLGMAKNTYGTGCFLLLNTGHSPRASLNSMLTTVAWQTAGGYSYALEGSVFVGGAVVQWLRDGLGIIKDSSEMERLAGTVPDNGGVYMVPAFVGLGAPYWDQYARGIIVGLTRGVNKYHIIRATLDSLCYQTNDVLRAMEADSGIRLAALKVDGGACANNYLMQTQADIINAPVQRPRCVETTAMGAAYLAGLAVGYWMSKEDVVKNWAIDRTFAPNIGAEEREKRIRGWNKALKCAYGWAKD